MNNGKETCGRESCGFASMKTKWVTLSILLFFMVILSCRTFLHQNTSGKVQLILTKTIISPHKTQTPTQTMTDNTVDQAIEEKTDSLFLRQGAAFGFLEPYSMDDIATGNYRAEVPLCGNSWLNTLPST